MSTGLTTWHINPLDLGPLYPFVGSEMFWVLLGLATWIVWHIVQIRGEEATMGREDELFKDSERLVRAMRISKAETLIESLKGEGDEPLDR